MTRRLDPEDWTVFRKRAHAILDRAIDHMEKAGERPVWRKAPDGALPPLDDASHTPASVDETLNSLLPFGVGNTHPRFFGWVHGAGTPTNILAEMAASAMNANCGGRDHIGIRVEREVVQWALGTFGFPEDGSGLIVSGTSMATIIAVKTARDAALQTRSRREGVSGHKLVGYTSSEAHACVERAFDMVGLGAEALRKVRVTENFTLDVDALNAQIEKDKAAGLQPFFVSGTAGTVNTGATDNLDELSDVCARYGLWFHVDGAFGACAQLHQELRKRLTGIEKADSLAFDFHKWLQVNYDAGCVLFRDAQAHLDAFSDRPDYLAQSDEGLAAGFPWPVDLGPELSRGFRALKVWAHLYEFGTERLAEVIAGNCEQAAHLARLVDDHPALERLAPAPMNIVCFRYAAPSLGEADLDELNNRIVIALQIKGFAVPSTTRIGGKLAIRVNITNHRTTQQDVEAFLKDVLSEGQLLRIMSR